MSSTLMTDDELSCFLTDQGYENLRKLPSGVWIGTMRMLFTQGLFYGLDRMGYSHRYCYEPDRFEDCFSDVKNWDGEGDPQGKWVAKK